MSRTSTYVLLLQAQKALHRAFGFGPKRQAQFRKALAEVSHEYADMCLADAAEDRTISYTREKLDRALRQACGEIQPFEERYDPMNILYERKKAKET